MKHLVAISLFVLFFISCDSFKSKKSINENDIILATVADNQLYISDIASFNFENLSPEDSVVFLKKYVANWIKDEVFVLKAKEKLSNLDEIEADARKFENDLIKAAYQKKVTESLELSLNEEDLNKYYEAHKEYFLFEENHYEIKYIILPKSVSNLQQIRKTISQGKNSNFLSSYCTNNQGKCHIKLSQIKDATFLTSVLKLKESQLKVSSNYNYHYIDSENVMIYQIIDVKEEGTIAPLDLVRKEVSVLSMHNKKQEYLLELEEKSYQKAKNDKIFENYIN